MARTLRPLDLVRTPKGAIALVTEVSGRSASITYLRNQSETWEHVAWWEPRELTVLDNLAAVIADGMANPAGDNEDQGNVFRLPSQRTEREEDEEEIP